MPELPEVETTRLGLTAAMRHKYIQNIKVHRRDLRVPVPPDFARALEGRKISHTLRRGKYILAFAENGAGFILHLGMSGRIAVHPPAPPSPAPQRHDHIAWHMEDGTTLVFNDPRRFGMALLTTETGWQSTPPFDSMGPEPLEQDFTGAALAARLAGRKTPVKTALLDQTVVAGIGNIYACEALFDAGIHPRSPAANIRGARAERLALALKDVLRKALAAGGSSLRDYQKTDGALGYFQHHFSVYDRAGQRCPGCTCAPSSAGILRIVQGGRSTFYCPARQKK